MSSSIKYSVIIPTAFDHLERDLKPCIESIVKNTDLSNVEIIIVANGCTDNTVEYTEELILKYPGVFKVLVYPDALGYALAVNRGLEEAAGQFVVLLNNDIVLQNQPTNLWLTILEEPIVKDPSVGITGPMKRYNKEGNTEFIVFFCAMIQRSLVDKLHLSTDYGIGTCEDVEYCIEARKLGFKIEQTSGTFPIWHRGSSTMNSLSPDFVGDTWKKNPLILGKKYNTPWYQEQMKKNTSSVLAFVPTRNRYDCLPLCLQAIATQTRVPDRLIIYDDGKHEDLRKQPIYSHIFKLLDSKGIKWEVVFGHGRGQHFGHQLANTADCELVWRVDDDEVPEVNVLESLLKHFNPSVGAVAGSVFTPGERASEPFSGNITDIFHANNFQWRNENGIYEVDHLYSSFLYRAHVVNYNLSLSPVAHREETLFTHALKRKGYKLIVDTSIKTYHYRYPTGGIRESASQGMFEHDNEVFKNQLEAWGIKVVTVDGGLGDHLVFANVIPDLLKKYSHLIVGCVYPDVFKEYSRVTTAPVASTKTSDNDNIYKFCIDNNWTKPLVDAYRKMLNL